VVNFGKGYNSEEVRENQAPPEVTEVLEEDDGPFFRVVELYKDEVCQSCPLLPHRNRVVGYEFFGDPPYRVVFIGEAPGEEEALSGRPFVGRSGQILRAVLRETWPGKLRHHEYRHVPTLLSGKSGLPS
jgi:hypothetical protein